MCSQPGRQVRDCSCNKCLITLHTEFDAFIKQDLADTSSSVLHVRILSDWLEVKMGGDTAPEVREEKQDGTLQTLCVISALQEMEGQTHKVHITIKVS